MRFLVITALLLALALFLSPINLSSAGTFNDVPLATARASLSARYSANPDEFRPGEIIVKFKQTTFFYAAAVRP